MNSINLTIFEILLRTVYFFIYDIILIVYFSLTFPLMYTVIFLVFVVFWNSEVNVHFRFVVTLYLYVDFIDYFFLYLFIDDINFFVDLCFSLCVVLRCLRIFFLSLNYDSLIWVLCVVRVIIRCCVIVWMFHVSCLFCFLHFFT